MTTFEMAQKAFENPGKVFVGKLNGDKAMKRVCWSLEFGGALEFLDGGPLPLAAMQANGWQWEEEKTPRVVEFETSVEYTPVGATCKEPPQVHDLLREKVGSYDGVKGTRWRVKVTAEEVL